MRLKRLGASLILVAAIAGAELALRSHLTTSISAGMWHPTGVLPAPGDGRPNSWEEVRRFAISMESSRCIGDGADDPTLDRVEVNETDAAVTITAFAETQECGEGVGAFVDAGVVTLAKPLGTRKLLDGSVGHRYVVGPQPDWDLLLKDTPNGS